MQIKPSHPLNSDDINFVNAHTEVKCTPLVPEIKLHLASDVTSLWHATESHLDVRDAAPPYWAFAWPGSQALARFILDNPKFFTNKRVTDFAAGSGLAAIACARVGACAVTAVDIDPLSAVATTMNADLNDVTFDVASRDIMETVPDTDVLICGDVCYDRKMTTIIIPWLRKSARDVTVIMADPARAFAPSNGMEALSQYDVPVSTDLEDRNIRRTTLYRILKD